MPQSNTISHTTISDHRPPATSTTKTKTEPLRLTKRRPTRTPIPQSVDQASSSPSTDGNIQPGTVQRPPRDPSPLFDPNDPAFSTDPFQHPDHDVSSLNRSAFDPSLVKRDAKLTVSNWDTDAEPPPSYDDTIHSPIDANTGRNDTSHTNPNDSREVVQGSSSHIRETAETSYSPLSTPFSSNSNLPQLPRHNEGDNEEDAEREAVLAYLNDDRDNVNGAREHDIPASLRPHRGVPIPPEQNNASLSRSTTLPATRTVSEPLAGTNTERPRLPSRGNTTPRHAPENLDRIDELDESVLLGVPLHHRGPYEMAGKVDTPPPRVLPLDRQHQPAPKQHIIVATTPLNAPPPPIPFKLNLKPGEILTRVPPPSRSQTTPPERNQPPGLRTFSPGAAEQPTSERSRPGPLGQIDPRHAYRSNERNAWSPERLYEDYAGSTPVVSQHRYAGAMASSAAVPPAAMPRTDVRPIIRPSPDTRQLEERLAVQNHVTFQQQPQQSQQPRQPQQPQQPQQPLLSRSISQPVQVSSASAYSASSASISRAPPSALDRFRPKQIVLPAPLQAQSQNQNGTSYTLPSELVRRTGQNGVSAKPSQQSAAVIPVHDPKKGNFLKKRASFGASFRPSQKTVLPERSASTKGFLGLGGIFGKSPSSDPELMLSKANRKLSKRGK